MLIYSAVVCGGVTEVLLALNEHKEDEHAGSPTKTWSIDLKRTFNKLRSSKCIVPPFKSLTIFTTATLAGYCSPCLVWYVGLS